MARLARIVVPGIPHHVTQRGVRGMRVFFSDADYRAYLRILGRMARRHRLAVWAYCLMPNHVHLLVVPSDESGLARPLGEGHRRYALQTNRRRGWTGHLWQERFASFPMDEPHLRAAIRYVLLNPVRAGLVASCVDWPHSSARAHVCGESDSLIDPRPCAERITDWARFLESRDDGRTEAVRNHTSIGRPLGSEAFVEGLERVTGRRLTPRRAGRRAKRNE